MRRPQKVIVPPIKYARPSDPPLWLRFSRSTPRQQEGCRYERLFAEEAAVKWPSALRGQWWQYKDAEGHHWAQTDLWVPEGGGILIECKLTWTPAGMRQLEELYVPLVTVSMGRPPLAVLVCHNLARKTPRRAICANWSQVEALAPFCTPILHWIGGPLPP